MTFSTPVTGSAVFDEVAGVALAREVFVLASVFDVGASAADTLQLKASDGNMDFYVLVGEPKDVLSQYTDLTGRPALLPRWVLPPGRRRHQAQ